MNLEKIVYDEQTKKHETYLENLSRINKQKTLDQLGLLTLENKQNTKIHKE